MKSTLIKIFSIIGILALCYFANRKESLPDIRSAFPNAKLVTSDLSDHSRFNKLAKTFGGIAVEKQYEFNGDFESFATVRKGFSEFLGEDWKETDYPQDSLSGQSSGVLFLTALFEDPKRPDYSIILSGVEVNGNISGISVSITRKYKGTLN